MSRLEIRIVVEHIGGLIDRRKLKVALAGRERSPRALERTSTQTILLDVVAHNERVVVEIGRAVGLIVRRAQAEAVDAQRPQVVVAPAHLCGHQLDAEVEARVARVRVVAGDYFLEQIRIGERRTDQLVVLIHTALAVRERPLVVLGEEGAAHAYCRAGDGREDERRRLCVVRIVAGVLNEHVERAASSVRAELVGHTGVQVDGETERSAGQGAFPHVDCSTARVEAGVEAIAAVKVRMPYPLEVARVALAVVERAINDHRVQVAELPLYRVGHVRAGGVQKVALQLQDETSRIRREAQVGLLDELDGEVGRERVVIADGDRGKCGLLLEHQAVCGDHLEVLVLVHRIDDQIDAHAAAEHKNGRPHALNKSPLGSNDVRYAVHFELFHLFLQFHQPMMSDTHSCFFLFSLLFYFKMYFKFNSVAIIGRLAFDLKYPYYKFHKRFYLLQLFLGNYVKMFTSSSSSFLKS